jgi:hypothetical protein
MVFENSRYASGDIYYDEDVDSPFIVMDDLTINPDTTDYYYQYKSWDRLDILANQFYGSPQKKWIILNANPQYVTELDIKAGDIIVIPNPERM